MNTTIFDFQTTPSSTAIRTLVADDSPLMLKLVSQILKRAGNFELVGTATNGCQALRYVSELSPDLVLTDLHMPGLNGLQATQCIKDREHPPVVIVISSDDGPITRARVEESGADGFVSKARNLRSQLIGMLQDLFPAETRQMAAGSGIHNSQQH